tara:strand:+ start:8779 stop:8934 length:156 start_codon:yes stop_codon:yes gene_type:complete
METSKQKLFFMDSVSGISLTQTNFADICFSKHAIQLSSFQLLTIFSFAPIG